MRILGIDPGTHILGYAFLEKRLRGLRAIDFGVIETSREEVSAGERLLEIHHGIEKLFARHNPECVALERLFFFKNQKTVMSVAGVRGVVLLTAALHGIPSEEYTPLEVKMSVTGDGRADKKQVQKMVRLILELDETPEPDDAADALAIAICSAHHRW